MTIDEIIVKYPLLYSNGSGPRCGFNLGDGWLPIVDALSAKIEEVNRGLKMEEIIVCHQVKEKFGDFTYYIGGCPEGWEKQVYDWINEARNAAENVCEECGKPAERKSNVMGWWRTVCDECKQEMIEERSKK